MTDKEHSGYFDQLSQTWQSINPSKNHSANAVAYYQSMQKNRTVKIILPSLYHLILATTLLYLAVVLALEGMLWLNNYRENLSSLSVLLVAFIFSIMGIILIVQSIKTRWNIFRSYTKQSQEFFKLLIQLDTGNIRMCQVYQVLATLFFSAFLISGLLVSIERHSLNWGNWEFHRARLAIGTLLPLFVFLFAAYKKRRFQLRRKQLCNLKNEMESVE